MSKQWGHGYATGAAEGFSDGKALEKQATAYEVAQEMRVLICALVTAYKQEDSIAFWATVELAKKALGAYANFENRHWSVFDGRQTACRGKCDHPMACSGMDKCLYLANAQTDARG